MPVSVCESCLNSFGHWEGDGKGSYDEVKFGNLMAPLGRLSSHGGNWGEPAMYHKVQHLLFYDSCYSRWKKLIPQMRQEIQEQLSVDKSEHSYIVSAQL